MDKLVHDLLEYSRVTRAEMKIERVDLGVVFSEVVKAMEVALAERQAEVTADESFPSVLGHRPTLDQTLTNLLTNATKFVTPGVRPQIRVRNEVRDACVRLWFEDNGIGIPKEHHDRIFGVFERLHKQEDYPGTGIGLAIVKKAMERMGGKVGLESQVGLGSRFWIELPKVSV
jgi:signal transduction histidine kinase